MTWFWMLVVLAFVAVVFALGIVAALAFRTNHAPERRQGDRRKGDRRGSAVTADRPAREIWTDEQRAAYRLDHHLPTPDPDDHSVWTKERRAAYRQQFGLPEAEEPADVVHGPGKHERRTGERRKGERRKKQAWWPKATVVTAAAFLSVIGVVAYGEASVPSIFTESNPALAGSGWAKCDQPITWSLDTSRLTPADAKIAVDQMTTDFTKWGKASGLTFKYVGEVPTKYDDATLTLTSDTHPSNRHIYIAFLRNADSSMLDERTVGFATPTRVYPNNKEIVEGSVVMGIDYVKKVNRTHSMSLYLHELGHVLGLGHGSTKTDAMYYIVDTTNELSPQDIAGIRSLTKVCPTLVNPAG
ncbi:MAG: matrixin family metalloprotease [Actinomycetes bacterium]